MNRFKTFLQTALLVVVPALAVNGNPQLFVNYEGISGSGNHQWLVSAAPDPAFFSNTTSGFGSSLAVELAFAIEGSAIISNSVVENNVDWPFDNPGANPFTDTFTDGLWLNPALDKAFGAFGGNVFLSGAPVPLFGFDTLGSEPTTVHYGVAASGHPTKGSIIAQTGQNFPVELASFGELTLTTFGGSLAGSPDPGFREFTGYTGSVSSVPEPASVVLLVLALIAPVLSRSNRG